MKRSSIGYCDFSSGDLNFVTGCTPVSEGCRNCYARAIYARFGKDFSVTTHPDKLARLAKKQFPQDGNKRGPHTKPLCFVCDTGDLFHEGVPETFIAQAFAVMLSRYDITWLVLTKRPRRMQKLFDSSSFWALLHAQNDRLGGVPIVWPADYIWLGVTAENQAMADERIPFLLSTPAAIRWVSVEPMLEPVNLRNIRCPGGARLDALWGDVKTAEGEIYAAAPGAINWAVCGAESGPSRRLFDVAWALDLYQQCKAAGVAFFGKQGSAQWPGEPLEVPGCGTLVKEWPR